MFPLEIWVGAAMLGALIVYALSGGADFGVGVWDLLASGPRKDQQRVVLVRAIAPIWEIHHIWLLLVVTLLYVAFPLAFGAIYTALSIPFGILLVSLVLRGISFLMRAYVIQSEWAHESWRIVFGVSSMVAAIALGVCIGAVSSGTIRVQVHTGLVLTDAYAAWLAPFPLVLGLFILALFAFLAAVYLLHETDDEALQEDFRMRALIAGFAVFVLAWVSFALADDGAPVIRDGLWNRVWSIPFQGVTGMMSTAALCALCVRWYDSARILAIAQGILLILGWGLAQYPFLVVPDLTFHNAAASEGVLEPVLTVLSIGVLVLAPAFYYVYRTFKWRAAETKESLPVVEDDEEWMELVEVEEE